MATGNPVPEIIAHRGASFDAPENTLASLRMGWEQGADAGELDIQLSRDGQAVVLHDSSTLRTTGFDKGVSEQTLVELKQLDAGVDGITTNRPAWMRKQLKAESHP